MIWLDQQDEYAMFTVRHTERGYELVRLSLEGATTVEIFGRLDEATQRWRELEEILASAAPTTNHSSANSAKSC